MQGCSAARNSEWPLAAPRQPESPRWRSLLGIVQRHDPKATALIVPDEATEVPTGKADPQRVAAPRPERATAPAITRWWGCCFVARREGSEREGSEREGSG